MPDPLYGLTAADHEMLKHLIQQLRANPGILNTRNRPQIERERNTESSQVYVARTPTDGIPAVDLNTGTSLDDEPGEAECDIYQISRYSNPVTISPTAANDRLVYNVSTSPIPGDTWIVIAKDAFGAWIALAGGGSSVGRGKIASRLGDGIYSVQPIKRAYIGTAAGTSLSDYENTEWVNNGDVVSPCFRLPTEDDSPPPIPVGQGVLYGVDDIGYWLTPWGGQKKFVVTICRAVYCDGENLVTVVRDWDHSARDNCWRESAG